MTASVPAVFESVESGVNEGCSYIRLQYLFVADAAGRVWNIFGWSIREVHVRRSVYDALLKAMTSANLSIKESEISVASSDDGNGIIFHVCSCLPSLLHRVNRRFGVREKRQIVFFPFRESRRGDGK